MTLHELPKGYIYMLQTGDIVQEGDLMQIGSPPYVSYQPVCTPKTCKLNRQGLDCGGVGHKLTSTYARYWRKQA